MSDVITLEIADINFAIRGEAPIILHEPDPVYRPFFHEQQEYPGAVTVNISLEIDGMPDTERLTKVFDSGQSWSMFKDRDDYVLEFHAPAFEEPLWVARCTRDFASVTVYCGKKLVHTRDGRLVVSNPVCYPLDQILLMYTLASNQGVLSHAAGVEIKGRGFVFPGRSGAGKTTLARQFAARKGMTLLSDDRIVMRRIADAVQAFGTPWPGEMKIAVNKRVPLAALLFISHGSDNTIQAVKPREALERLLPVISIPWYDKDVMPKALRFCEDLVFRVPAYELLFKPGIEVVDVVQRFIVSEGI